MHHDIINLPFYGHPYDTSVIAHPLSISDSYNDPRTSSDHLLFLLDELRDIQWQREEDDSATNVELMARQDSIDVLNIVRKAWYGRNEKQRREDNAWFEKIDELTSAVPEVEAYECPERVRSSGHLSTIPEEDEERFRPPRRTCSRPRHATVENGSEDDVKVEEEDDDDDDDEDEEDESLRLRELRKVSSQQSDATIEDDDGEDEDEYSRLRNALQDIGFDI